MPNVLGHLIIMSYKLSGCGGLLTQKLFPEILNLLAEISHFFSLKYKELAGSIT